MTKGSWMSLKKLFRRPTICVAVALILGTAVAFLLTAIRGIPAPSVHDEFAYLLGADTFAAGRLTNPTHPMWEHFESFHIIQQPSYNAKYPPAQSLALAAGQLIGHPMIGSCLSAGFAIGCLVWMLTGWLPRKYYWLITLFAVFHPGLQIVWGQSYWGGNLALAGASLLLGALGRLTAKMDIRLAVIAGIGTVLLANTRPFEGAVLTVMVGMALTLKCCAHPNWKLGPFIWRVIVPGLVVVAVGAAGMLVYNNAVSKNCFKMPYQIHEAEYGFNPVFLWQTAGEMPAYRHPVMEYFFETDKTINDAKYRTLADVLRVKTRAGYAMVKFFCGGTIILALVGLPWMLRRPRFRGALFLVTPVFLASLATPWAWAHYCAPAAPLLILLFIGSLVEIWKRTRNVPMFRFAILLIIPVFHLTWCVSTYDIYSKLAKNGWAKDRVAIEQQLLSQPGLDLVLVRYTEKHNPNAEWVYNNADIDAAPVVWAREMSSQRRGQLIDYFKNRKIWILDADLRPPRLHPFENSAVTTPKFGMKLK